MIRACQGRPCAGGRGVLTQWAEFICAWVVQFMFLFDFATAFGLLHEHPSPKVSTKCPESSQASLCGSLGASEPVTGE